MQCKDISDVEVLEFLRESYERRGSWAGWHDLYPRSNFCPTVRDARPKDVPERLVLAKMRMLRRRNLISGCCCGCRGDFELTEKGRAFLKNAKLVNVGKEST